MQETRELKETTFISSVLVGARRRPRICTLAIKPGIQDSPEYVRTLRIETVSNLYPI